MTDADEQQIQTADDLQGGTQCEASPKACILPDGTKIGRYVLLSLLGQGGMGVVYKAYDPELDRRIAIKFMTVQKSGSAPETTSGMRLLREAQALAQLSHPNVVAVHDVGTYEQSVYIAMEFVEGQTLRDWLTKEYRSIQDRLSVLIAAGRGLSAAHKAGIIHRDFKPDNVIIGSDGRVRVLDFGLARAALSDQEGEPQIRDLKQLIDSKDNSLTPDPAQSISLGLGATTTHGSGESILSAPMTRVGAIMGTPAYMSPEQHLTQDVDGRTDQFSFCVVLYESLYGTRPFLAKHYMSLVRLVTKGRVRPPPSDTDVPEWLWKIVLRGLSPDRTHRFESMDQLLEQLLSDPIAATRKARAARNRILFGVALGALFAAGTIGVYRAMQPDSSLCQGAKDQLDAVWNKTIKADILNAFTQTGQVYALDTYNRVVRELDTYSAAWVSMHTEACVATHLRGEQSPELLDLRMICLAQRLKQLEALVNVLSHANAGVLSQSVVASQELCPIAACADLNALSARIKPPQDEATRQAVADITSILSRVKALHDTGRYQEGLADAQLAVTKARQTGYKPELAEALYWQGRQQERSAMYTESKTTMEEAWWYADVSSHDEFRARSAAYLVFIVGYQLANRDMAFLWADHGRAAIERMGGQPELLGNLIGNLGVIYSVAGDQEKALSSLQQSLEILRKEFGEESHRVATCYNSIASVYSAKGEFAKAIDTNERALAIRIKVLGEFHPKVGYSLAHLSEALHNVGTIEKAVQYGLRSLDILEKSVGKNHPDLLLPLNVLGNIYIGTKQYRQALDVLERSIGICAERACIPEVLDSAKFLLARALWDAGADRKRSIALAKQALESYSNVLHMQAKAESIQLWLKEHQAG